VTEVGGQTPAPSAWLIRGGEKGEREDSALAEGLVIAGWEELGDIQGCMTRESIRQVLRQTYPDSAENIIANWTGQLWRFRHQIAGGDLVVMPLHTRPGSVAIGEVTGAYQYRADQSPGFRHVRPVKWLRTDVARDAFRPDLRASITSLLTVCGLARSNAAGRIAELADKGVDPGIEGSEEITTAEELLEDAASRDSADPRRLSIRNLLEHWGQTRRSGGVVAAIKSDLADKGLTTRPPFTEGSVDDDIVIVAVAEPGGPSQEASNTEDVFQQAPATLRIGSLPPAKLVSVSPASTLTFAKSLMLNRQFSQLAVIGDDQRFLGAVSWESIGKAHIASAEPSLLDAITSAPVVDHSAFLLEQIDVIYSRGYVFVYNDDRSRVTGIVTAADLTRQFGSLARPFVLIEEAENRLRRRANEVFSVDELRAAAPAYRRAHISGASDLTLGNYVYLMKPAESWERLGWNLDREYFIERLEEVVGIRNELMHFTTDPLSPKQYDAVEGLLEMLRTVDPRP
jgi:restriction system protein